MKKFFFTLELIISLVILFSGCNSNDSSSVTLLDSSKIDNTTSSEELSQTSTVFESSEILSETSIEYTQIQQTTSNISTSSATETSQTHLTSNDISTTTSKPVPVTTTSITTKKPVTTTAPPEIIIPKIYSPSSPGTEVFSNELVSVDVSNKNSGYISAKYLGTNKKVKLQVIKGDVRYSYDLNSKAQVEIYPLQLGDGDYVIYVGENTSGTKYSMILQESISVKLTNPNLVFLYPNQFVNFNQDSIIVKKTAEICAGKKSDLEKIGAIFIYITDNVTYDKKKAETVSSGYLPNVDDTISTKKGICFDYAALFAAMCRAEGIPTRLITGYVAPNGYYHAWNEVYTNETGWITADIKLKTIGFNLLDSTFYAGSNNKAKIADTFTDNTTYQVYQIY